MTKRKPKRNIPPPPGPAASWEEKAAYYEKYEMYELEEAGYLRPLTAEEQKFADEVADAAAKSLADRKRRGGNLSVSENFDSSTDNTN